MNTIVCWGDSNTYGYDPRSFWEARYEADSRWCDLLEAKTGCQVVNQGMNGRCVPRYPGEYTHLKNTLKAQTPVDLLILLLGTNDILMGRAPAEIARDMESLILDLKHCSPELPILLLSPPELGKTGEFPQEAAGELAGLYRAIAQRRDIRFLSLGTLPLACDGVHFSEQGHRELASLLNSYLHREGLL